jgi:hypothetical protein
MIPTLSRGELDALIRRDLVDVVPTEDGNLELRIYDTPARDRAPEQVWRSSFDGERLLYLERRIEKAVIEMGWTAPRSLLDRLGAMQAAREAGHWLLVTR